MRGTSEFESCNNVTVHRLPAIPYPKINLFHRADIYYTFLPKNFQAIARILREHKVQILQVYGQFFDLTFMAVAAAKMLKIPITLTIGTRMKHPQAFYNAAFRVADGNLVKRLVADRVDRLVAVDKLMRNYIVERYHPANGKVRFIPAPVDVERFNGCDGGPVRETFGDDELVLSLGTISNLRNPISLVRAMPQVLREFPRAKLLFLGDVHNLEPVRLARSLGLDGSVRFCGRVDYGMVPAYLGACNLEGHDLDTGMGIGLASLEAMAAGKPVLSSARADNFLTIPLESWRNIVLVPPGDSEQIAEAITRLLSDKQLREKIGANARDLVTEYFSLDAICDRYEKLYEGLH